MDRKGQHDAPDDPSAWRAQETTPEAIEKKSHKHHLRFSMEQGRNYQRTWVAEWG
jgi:hypothetical protein